MADQYPRDRYERRKSGLKIERDSFMPHYRELAQFIAPRRGRFIADDRNRGGDRYNSIINSKATVAHRVARSGLLAGAMSPSSPWMSLGLEDPDLTHFMPAKVWLDKVEQLLYRIFASGNLYSQAPAMFGELLLFGTGAVSHVDDFADVARFYTFTAGSYMIGQDARQEVNTIVREWEMTVGQIVDEYKATGGQVSTFVQSAYDKGDYDIWVPVTHIVQPNLEFRPTSKLSQFKAFRSVTYEAGDALKGNTLRDKGFGDFPFYCPRWDVTAEDIYGTDCPAMTALGDIKGLQIEERRKAQAIDKMVNPPMSGPASVRNIDSLPGGLTTYESDGKQTLSPLYQVNPQLGELRLDMKAVEERIDSAFYVHLFRAISDMQGIQPKNELELRQRDQERLLELGPVLEHLHGEFLAKLVDRTIKQCASAGILPPPPPEIQGKQIKVTFISALARAQRSAAAASIERFTTFVAGLVQSGFKDAVYKLNAFDAIDEYAEVTGTTPRILVSNQDAEAQQQAIAAQQAQQQKQAQQAQMADSASKLGGAAAQMAQAPGAGGNTVLQNVAQAVSQRASPNLFGTR